MPKDLYAGVFNWHGQLFRLHRKASSQSQAKKLMEMKLSEDLGVSVERVSAYFNGIHDNVTIQKIGND
jgi:hypothetical protein